LKDESSLIKFVAVVCIFVSPYCCVVILLQFARMSHNLETVEGSQAEVTDDSCTAQFIEIVPLDGPSDDYHRPGFIPPVFEVKPEDLDEVKQEPADESNREDLHRYVKEEPDDEFEADAPYFAIKVSFQAVIAIAQLSSVFMYCRLVSSALFIVDRNGIRASVCQLAESEGRCGVFSKAILN